MIETISLSLSLFLKTNGSKEGTNEEVSTKGLGGKLTLRVREREREGTRRRETGRGGGEGLGRKARGKERKESKEK